MTRRLLISINKDSMAYDEIKGLRKQTRGHIHELWEMAKSGNLDSLNFKWLT